VERSEPSRGIFGNEVGSHVFGFEARTEGEERSGQADLGDELGWKGSDSRSAPAPIRVVATVGVVAIVRRHGRLKARKARRDLAALSACRTHRRKEEELNCSSCTAQQYLVGLCRWLELGS
jgi:hypothetical protein